MRDYAELDAYYYEIGSKYLQCASSEFREILRAAVSKHEATISDTPEIMPNFVEHMRKDVFSRKPEQFK